MSKSVKGVSTTVTLYPGPHYCVIKSENQADYPSTEITLVLNIAREFNFIISLVFHILFKVGITRSCHK